MANAHDNTQADPQAVSDARQMWVNFTVLMKWSTISTVIFLVFLALITL